MSGIDSDVELYRYMPTKTWPSILGYLEPLPVKKYICACEGQYSREAFDRDTGQMTFMRDYNMSDYRAQIELYGTVDLSNAILSDRQLSI